MTKLEDRLRTTLHATAALLPEAAPAPRPAPGRRWRGPAIAVASLAVVLLLVGGAVLVLGPGSSQDVLGGGDHFPIPEYLPAPADQAYGSFAVRDPEPAQIQAAVARVTGAGFSDAVLVSVADTPHASGLESEIVQVRGHQAELIEGGDGGATVRWVEDAAVVQVIAPSGDLALAVAEAVNFAPAGGFGPAALSFGALPAGFEVFAPPAMLPIAPLPVVALDQSVADGILHVEVMPDSLQHAAALLGAAEATTVRGKPAYRFGYPGGQGLVWAEAPGATVLVSGSYPAAELEAVAAGLRFVSEAAWRTHYAVTDSPFEVPSTTSPTNP